MANQKIQLKSVNGNKLFPRTSINNIVGEDFTTVVSIPVLDGTGKIKAENLPSFVDDVIELVAVSETAPASCAAGDMYFNSGSTNKKIYSATACGRDVDWQSPEMVSADFKDGAAVVKFSNCGKGLTAKKKSSVQGFEIAGADGRFYTASGKITGPDTIEAKSSRVPEPVYVRYFITGYVNSDSPVNTAGMPITPFSTSDEPLVFNGYLIQR